MSLLTQEPAPTTRRDRALTTRILLPAQAALERMFLSLRSETDQALGQGAPAKYGKPYPYGYCREITLDVLERLKKRPQLSDGQGSLAMRAFVNAGGEGRCVWGILRGRYFQTALQFGRLYVDVANDTVVVTKPKVEILPMAESGLEAVRDAWHFAEIAESYWGMQVYANHALPSLAPILPMIGVKPGVRVGLESATDYMTELFRRDGFQQSERWLAEGPPPPAEVVEALRSHCSPKLLSANPNTGVEAAIAICQSARAMGLASNKAWLRECMAEYEQLHFGRHKTQARQDVSSNGKAQPGSAIQPAHPSELPGAPMSTPTLTLDGRQFLIETLPKAAQTHVANIQFVDGEIARLQAQLSAMQTARSVYVEALRATLTMN